MNMDSGRIALCYPPVNSNLRVQMVSKLLFNGVMKTIEKRRQYLENRRQHLILAIAEFGGIERLSAATGVGPKYLSQLKNGTRNIGDATVEKLESALGIRDGAWDEPAPSVDRASRSPESLKTIAATYRLMESLPEENLEDAFETLRLFHKVAASKKTDADSPPPLG